MTIKDLKEAIKDLPDENEVVIEYPDGVFNPTELSLNKQDDELVFYLL